MRSARWRGDCSSPFHEASEAAPIRAEVCNGMKLRIIIRVSPVTSDVTLNTVCKVFKQLPCRMGGHREELDLSAGKLALKCSRCGWRSTGWALDTRPPLKMAG